MATKVKMKEAPMAGLSPSHRIDWRLPENRAMIMLANHGISANTIILSTGLTSGQVAYRLHKRHLTLRAYRNGESTLAKTVIERYRII